MAQKTLKKDPAMKKQLTDWMNCQGGNCTKEQALIAIPELNEYSQQSVAQTFNRHLPNAVRIGKSGGASGASHFKAALAETRRGAAVDLQTMVDGEETDDGSLMEPNFPTRNSAAGATCMMVSLTPRGGGTSFCGIATVGGGWCPIHRIFEWNKPVDKGKAKVVYGVDIIPFGGCANHTVSVEGNRTVLIIADHPKAFKKPKAIHDTMGKDVMTKMITDPNAKSTYDNLLIRSVAGVQHMTNNRNKQKKNHGKAIFKVTFSKNTDKKNVTMKVVQFKHSPGKWSKQLVVDAPQSIENEYVKDLQVASGSPVQVVGVRCTEEH